MYTYMFKDLILALKDKNDKLIEKLVIDIRSKQNINVDEVNKISPNHLDL